MIQALKEKRVGETTTAKCGMNMKIIAYRSSTDVDVEFEDGTVITNKSYNSFKKGTISNPNCPYQKPVQDKTGTRGVGRNGMGMTIIAYRNTRDIDVQFDDGTIVEHKAYNNFRAGYIQHPGQSKNQSAAKTKIKQNAANRVGEQIVNTITGELMTLVAYHHAMSVDIMFPDGTIVNRHYNVFKSGNVKKTAIPKQEWDKTGMETYSGAGIRMKVIKYVTANDITVEFEDGTVVENVPFGQFKSGNLLHPQFRKNNTHNKLKIGNWVVEGLAYVHLDGSGEFFCRDMSTGQKDIMTISEIKKIAQIS